VWNSCKSTVHDQLTQQTEKRDDMCYLSEYAFILYALSKQCIKAPFFFSIIPLIPTIMTVSYNTRFKIIWQNWRTCISKIFWRWIISYFGDTVFEYQKVMSSKLTSNHILSYTVHRWMGQIFTAWLEPLSSIHFSSSLCPLVASRYIVYQKWLAGIADIFDIIAVLLEGTCRADISHNATKSCASACFLMRIDGYREASCRSRPRPRSFTPSPVSWYLLQAYVPILYVKAVVLLLLKF
jgi:hypothetical protein